MGSPYTDLDRPPLHATALRRALLVPDGLWTALDLHEQTGSTNADAAAAARDGAAEGLIVVAERQTAGRGRLDRRWESPARAGLAVSVLLRPGRTSVLRAGRTTAEAQPVPPSRLGWLPLLAGVALVESVRRVRSPPRKRPKPRRKPAPPSSNAGARLVFAAAGSRHPRSIA